MYYVLSNRNGSFLNFITNGQLDFGSRGGDASFLLFRDEDERIEFESYLETNIDEFQIIEESPMGVAINKSIEEAGKKFRFDPAEMIKVKDIFNLWKSF
jgi:hypothetical protein